MTLKIADFYGGTTARGAGSISVDEQASSEKTTLTGGMFPTVWLVGIVLALVALRVAYELAD